MAKLSVTKKALCHPERRLQARGLCNSCYSKQLMKENPAYKARQMENAKKYRINNPDIIKRHLATRKKKEQQPELAQKIKQEKWIRVLWRKYKLSLNAWQELIRAQQGRCKLCYAEPVSNKKLHVDHCHKTGRVRGLVCFRCNWYLSLIDKDINILDRLRDHVKEFIYDGT